MKKNLMTVITMVLCLVNLVLSAVIVFAVVPEINNVNALISKVSQAIELDVQTGSDADGASTVAVENQYMYSVNGGEAMTINLKDNGDGESHFVVAKITATQNITSEKYATFGGETNAATYDNIYKMYINQVVSQYTIDDIKTNQNAPLDEIRDLCNSYFGDNSFIVAVGFTEIQYQ
ncbi:MAG: flagellar basal body-associated protein FliL [Lachnospiraceae bacterium]|nr:flagellar basal body-associated protein FliL [Lachnospiraceae bacterium]